MASPRITKVMREGIVRNTIEHTFKKEAQTLAKREAEVAELAYRQAYTPTQVKGMKNLGEQFVSQSNCITINVDGKVYSFLFGGGMTNTPWEYNGPNTLKKLAECKSVSRFVAQSRSTPLVPDASLKAKADALAEAQNELHIRVRKAEVQLMATLESVQSFKKLRAVWPQGEKFYDMYDVDSETKAGVPAVVITELNNILGLK